MKLIVASKNPVKIAAVATAFETLFEKPASVQGVKVMSGVSNQPMSDEETQRGALQRATAARKKEPTADLWVGIEGGIQDPPNLQQGMMAFAWIVVISKKRRSFSRTATFPLPEPIARLVRAGHELGEADDIVFGKSNSKQQEGAIGILTGGKIDRQALYAHAVTMALLPFYNEKLYRAQ